MDIYKTARADLQFTYFTLRGIRYRSASVRVYFSLENGRIIPAIDGMKTVTEGCPDVVLDENLPKLQGEWLAFGSIYRQEGASSGLGEVLLGDTRKRIVADFSGTDLNSAPLRDPAASQNDGVHRSPAKNPSGARLYLYEDHAAPAARDMNPDLGPMAQDHPERMKHFGGTPGSLYSLPDGFDFAYCSSAPADQRTSGEWHSGEHYEITGLVPPDKGGILTGSLPEIHPRCFAVAADGHEMSRGELHFDSVVFLPDLNTGIMIWHCLFPFDPEQDFSLMMAALDEDLMTEEEIARQQYPDEGRYAALATEILEEMKRKRESPKPEVRISKRVAEIRKESRDNLLRRYSEVYSEHIRFRKIFHKFPDLNPLVRDRISPSSAGGLKAATTYTAAAARALGVDPEKQMPGYRHDDIISRILRGEILESEKNFCCQISALMHRAVENLARGDCGDLLKIHDRQLQGATSDRSLLGWIPENQVCSREIWGLPGKGEFVIPAGLAVPEFTEKELLSVTVYPKGISSPEGAFVIPGSTPGDRPVWSSGSLESFSCKIIAPGLTEALLLSEELWHFLETVMMPDPSYPVQDRVLKELGDADFMIIPCLEEQRQAVYDTWHEAFPKVPVITVPLGTDQEGKPFETLLDRLLYQEETIAAWMNPHLPFPLPEPEHITAADYAVAYDEVLTRTTRMKPMSLDFTARALEINEEKRQEVLALCRTSAERKAVNSSFDATAQEIRTDAVSSDAALVAKAVQKQKENLSAKLPKLPAEWQPEGDPLAVLDEHAAALYDRINTSEKNARELADHIKALDLAMGKSDEEKLAATNLTAPELADALQAGVRSFTDLMITGRHWNDLDLAGITFSNCQFDEVTFTSCVFREARFTSCVFSSCVLEKDLLNGAELTDCEFINTSFENGDLTGARITGATFSGCGFDRTVCRNATFNNCSEELCRHQGTVLTGAALTGCSYSFCEFSGSDLTSARIDGMFLSECQIRKTPFREIAGERLILEKSLWEDADLSGGVLRRLEIREVRASMLQAPAVRIIGLTVEDSTLEKAVLDGAVLDDVFVRSSDFSGASFRKTVSKKGTYTLSVMRGCDFFHANLLQADFSGTKLGEASFEEASLFEADFRDAALGDNNFDRANLDRTLISYLSDPGI